MTKFRNRYRIESNRKPQWDYAGEGVYFITLCVNHRRCLFGNVENGKMILNDFGEIAYNEWMKSAQIRQELELDEFVVMPNHVHGIVIIRDGGSRNDARPVDARPCVSTGIGKNMPHREFKSISSFLAGYKSAVTTKIDNWIDLNHADIPKFNRYNKLWQPNYHDHIIRDNEEYYRIKLYIIRNPDNWQGDRFYGMC